MHKKKKIKLSVYWPDELKSIIITHEDYQEILNGKPCEFEGEGYHYEGETFEDSWSFDKGKLIITYGDDGAVGFDGTIEDCKIEEL